MKKHHEQLLVAALAGVVILGAASFAIQPAMAAGDKVEGRAQVTDVAKWDQLNLRKWPAAHSQKVGALAPKAKVWVERCVTMEQGADWCLVERGARKGWVNSRFLTLADD